MSRYIKKVLYKEKKPSKEGGKYTVYHYMLDDGLRVSSIKEFKVGDRVETWFNEKYNRPIIKLYEAN